MPEFKLTRDEQNSALWVKLEKHLKNRLTINREINDQTLSEQKTAEVRGTIKALKELIDLGTDRDAGD